MDIRIGLVLMLVFYVLSTVGYLWLFIGMLNDFGESDMDDVFFYSSIAALTANILVIITFVIHFTKDTIFSRKRMF